MVLPGTPAGAASPHYTSRSSIASLHQQEEEGRQCRTSRKRKRDGSAGPAGGTREGTPGIPPGYLGIPHSLYSSPLLSGLYASSRLPGPLPATVTIRYPLADQVK